MTSARKRACRPEALLHGTPGEWARRAQDDYTAAAAPVLDALADVGFKVATVAELYRTKPTYRAAITVLTRWLSRVTHRGVKEDIVRALTDRAAKPVAAAPLVAELKNAVLGTSDPEPSPLPWAIGNALSVVADASVFDDLLSIASDVRFGTSRQMVAIALGSLKDARALPVLLELLGDEQVVGHAVIALGRLGLSPAREALLPLRTHDKPWVRKEVVKALSKLDS